MKNEKPGPLQCDAGEAAIALRLLRIARQSGLSLIELVLVLAIAAILGGIAVSFYRGFTEEARLHETTMQLRNIGFILDDMARDGALPDSLAEIGADTLTDAWGNGYQYLRIAGAPKSGLGKMRKDKSLVPLNSDYDLYSMGPDGDSKPPLTAKASHDDLIRADNGGYYGVAEDY